MYVFDEKIIHDSDAMWGLALVFKARYKQWSMELEKVEKGSGSMMYDNDLIFKYDDEKLFKKAVSDYKRRVKTLESMIEYYLKHDSNDGKSSKYITKS